ncbi:MAG: peptide ABC transporter substrate-binding protein [Steroidobacteraceae bacterium]
MRIDDRHPQSAHSRPSLPRASLRVRGLLLAAALLAAPLAMAATLHRGIGNDPDSLDPHKAIGTSASILIYDLFEGLVTVDARGEVVPGAASEWKTDATQKTWTFTLRPGLKWSDGSPLTAADFEYSLRRLMLPETAARYASFLYPIRNARAVNTGRAPVEALGVKAVDARTLRIELEAPAPQLTELLTSVGAVAVPRQAIEKSGREWTRPGQIVTSGAYVPVDISPQTFIKARRNPNYRDAANVAIDEVVYYPVEDEGTSYKRFQAGELDIALKVPTDKLEAARRDYPGQLHSAPSLGMTMLMLNHREGPFADARVRRALALAIDRSVLADRILRRTALPAYTIVPASLSRWAPRLPAYAAQPIAERQAQARQLLAAAGYGPGKPLRFTMQYFTEAKTRTLAVAMVSMWRTVGAQCELVNKDLGSVISSVRAGAYQVSLYAWFSSFDDPSTFLDLLTTKARGSLSGYSNPQFDQAFATANAAADPAERYAALAAAETVAMDDVPVIPLFTNINERLVSRRVEGWTDNPRGANLTRHLKLRN